MNPPRGKTCKTIGPLKGIANIFHSGRPICFSIKSIETSVSKVSYYAVTMFLFFPLPSLFPPFSLFLSFSLLSPCCFPFFPPFFSSFFLSKTDCPMITAAHNGAQAGKAKVTSSNDGQTSSSDAKSTVLEQTTSKAAGFLWASKDFLVLKRCANNAETRSNGPRQCQPQCGRLRTFKSCSNKAQAESKPNNYPF